MKKTRRATRGNFNIRSLHQFDTINFVLTQLESRGVRLVVIASLLILISCIRQICKPYCRSLDIPSALHNSEDDRRSPDGWVYWDTPVEQCRKVINEGLDG